MRIIIHAKPDEVKITHHPITGRPKVETSNPFIFKALCSLFGGASLVDPDVDERGRRRR